jgi:hypothetical protein
VGRVLGSNPRDSVHIGKGHPVSTKKRIMYSLLAIGLAVFVIVESAPPSNIIHLRAKPSDDRYVRMWKVPGSSKPSYRLVPETANCIRMSDYIHTVKMIKSYYYIQVRCNEIYGFVSNYDVRELRSTP